MVGCFELLLFTQNWWINSLANQIFIKCHHLFFLFLIGHLKEIKFKWIKKTIFKFTWCAEGHWNHVYVCFLFLVRSFSLKNSSLIQWMNFQVGWVCVKVYLFFSLEQSTNQPNEFVSHIIIIDDDDGLTFEPRWPWPSPLLSASRRRN